MIRRIVALIKSAEQRIDGNTLFCANHVITDPECIEFLEEKNVLEQPILSNKLRETVSLELSLFHLNSLGFYENVKTFVSRRQYEEPVDEYYLHDLGIYSSEDNVFFWHYKAVLQFAALIQRLSKHTYEDLDVSVSVLFRDDKSLFLPLSYGSADIESFDEDALKKLDDVNSLLKETSTERQILFMNELIDYLQPITELQRLSYLLQHFKEYYYKSANAYQFYLSNFSSNKFKLELDSKALEFTQKIQGVINDSQGKLIAIPTAFVLAFSALDYEKLTSPKNIACIISLFIFSIIIQVFLQNQKSVLQFIEGNINSYKEELKSNEIEKISSKFNVVSVELQKQKNRLRLVEWILWIVPIGLLIFWIGLLWMATIAKIENLLSIYRAVITQI